MSSALAAFANLFPAFASRTIKVSLKGTISIYLTVWWERDFRRAASGCPPASDGKTIPFWHPHRVAFEYFQAQRQSITGSYRSARNRNPLVDFVRHVDADLASGPAQKNRARP